MFHFGELLSFASLLGSFLLLLLILWMMMKLFYTRNRLIQQIEVQLALKEQGRVILLAQKAKKEKGFQKVIAACRKESVGPFLLRHVRYFFAIPLVVIALTLFAFVPLQTHRPAASQSSTKPVLSKKTLFSDIGWYGKLFFLVVSGGGMALHLFFSFFFQRKIQNLLFAIQRFNL